MNVYVLTKRENYAHSSDVIGTFSSYENAKNASKADAEKDGCKIGDYEDNESRAYGVNLDGSLDYSYCIEYSIYETEIDKVHT